jgi:purine-binding chemotaxis protein CheW
LGLNVKEYDSETRIIVVDLNDKTIGFIVDEVKEVLRIPKSITEQPPEIVSGVDAEYITAIGKLEDRLLILLDLTKILSNNEENELK